MFPHLPFPVNTFTKYVLLSFFLIDNNRRVNVGMPMIAVLFESGPTTINCSRKDRDIPSKLSLPIFGLAFTKFKISVWDPEGDSEDQKANSLRRAADNWIRQLQVNHPDYKFFSTNYSYCR